MPVSDTAGLPRILVVGSSNTDMIIKVDRIPKPGETILGGAFTSASGGKGANQAVSAARAGGAVTFLARVGDDLFGENAVAGLVADGINVEHVVRDGSAPSGAALIFVDKEGENSIAVAPGANSNLGPVDLKKAENTFRRAELVVLQLETPLKTVEAAVKLATESGVRVLLNPAPACALPESLLKEIFLLTPNETEAELLTGLPVNTEIEAEKAAEKLLERGVQNAIVTMGIRGAYVAGKTTRVWIPAYEVKAVDATAAGDVFNGTLALALAEGKSVLEAARFANAAAAVSVTRIGAQTSIPTRDEIEFQLGNGKVRELLAHQTP